MRVWIINHYACSPSDAGGTRHFSLAKELISRGHEVVVFSSSFVHYAFRQRQPSGKRSQTQQVDGVPFVWVRTPGYQGNGVARVWNMLVFALRTATIRRSSVGLAPDVVLGSSPHLFAAYAAMKLASRHRVPFVLEIRDLWPDTFVALGGFSPKNPFIRLLEVVERRLYKKANLILSLLPAARERLVAKGADERLIRWLPNGVDFSMVPDPTPPPEAEKLIGMYAGAHGSANMLDGVLDAAKMLEEQGWLRRVEIHLVGAGPEKRRLVERTKTENIAMVRFFEPVGKPEIYEVLGRADFCLLLLNKSGLWQWGISPNKLFDYMALARPVILAAESPQDPVSMAQAGLTIPPEDAASLANAIKALADATPSERWEMGLRGRRLAIQDHSSASLGEKLESFLSETVEGTPLDKGGLHRSEL